jgi:putative transposase
MSGVVKINITQSESELHLVLRQQKTAAGKERVQALYLLKTKQVESVKHLAVVLGRSRVTLQRWLRKYRQEGLSGLLQQKKSPGRKKVIGDALREKLFQELADPEGFKSYGEVQLWLKAVMGVEASYKVVHDTVRYQLKAKLKVPRPQGVKHKEKTKEAFKKNSPSY